MNLLEINNLINSFFLSPFKSIDEELLINKKIDQLFNIDFNLIEASLSPHATNNLGEVEVDGLNTFYRDILSIEKNIFNLSHITDVGAGYCRMALLLSIRNPKLKFTCIDIENNRMMPAREFAKKHHLNIEFIDISIDKLRDFKTDCLFFYFPFCMELVAFLNTNLSDQMKILAIESHGDFIDFLDLYLVHRLKSTQVQLIAPRHNQYLVEYNYQFNPSDENKKRVIQILWNDLTHTGTLDFVHQDDQLTYLFLFRISALQDIKIEFNDFTQVKLVDCQICFFEQYQLEIHNPRKVYRFSQISKFLL